MRKKSLRSRGFSLIELMTVIAIIAILAAIIFPVATSVRRRAQESACMSNLNQIYQAVKMYRLDERRYPDSLGPYVIGTYTVKGMTGEQIKNSRILTCPANDFGYTDPEDRTKWGEALVPIAPLQRFTASPQQIAQIAPTDPLVQGARFFKWDSYDGFVTPQGYELHYSRFRTFDQRDPEYKRQLAFRNPPEDTVITWCSYFRNYTSTGVLKGGDDIVLFLSGQAKKFPAQQIEICGWRIKPEGCPQ